MRALDRPAAYVPVDISREHLRDAAISLAEDFPSLPVVAVCADYTRAFPLPPLPGPSGKRVGFFPGSTIGNFEPDAAVDFLANYARILGSGGEMLIGVDLKKDPEILDAAYNDRAGVTAAFNLNLLERINRELDGDLDIDRFEHVAFYNETKGRIEIYIRSLANQEAWIAGTPILFAKGELVHTEYSYKYSVDEFRALGGRAGFSPVDTWTDPAEAVQRALLPAAVISHAVEAPSTGRAAPETNDASSEIRNNAALAISSGLPVRPIGFWRPRS